MLTLERLPGYTVCNAATTRALPWGGEEPLEIAVCGLSYRSSPVAVLERVAIPPERRRQALLQLTADSSSENGMAPEAVILSTCNRVEVYAALHDCDSIGDSLVRFLAGFNGLAPLEIEPYVYTYQGEAAVRHLLQVATGLDSLIVGEPQILGQVREAFEAAREVGASGPILSALFRRALQTGKRVRTETGISQHAASVSYASVEVASRQFADLGACRALVVGAGKTGQLTAQCLVGRGVRQITVANRSYQRALETAEAWGGSACTLDGLDQALETADIVISATNAPDYVVTAEQVRKAQAARDGRPILLVDIAMPRDIDPAAATVPGVQLYNLDNLHTVVEANLALRRGDSQRAEEIIENQVDEFLAWFKALGVTPLITDLRDQAETIRRRELDRVRNRLGQLSPEDLSLIDRLTQRIINQLLHEPTVRLKERARQADGALYAEALRDLFALDDKKGQA